MTPPELLEELKQVDPETYEALRNYPRYVSGDEALSVDLPGSRNQTLCEDAIQGSIQRACERYGWELEQNYRTRGQNGDLPKNIRHYAVVTSWDNDVHTYRGMGNSATKALLAAYMAAVKGEKQ